MRFKKNYRSAETTSDFELNFLQDVTIPRNQQLRLNGLDVRTSWKDPTPDDDPTDGSSNLWSR